MAFSSGIFTSNNGDRLYTTAQLATFYKGMMSTGVYPNYLNNMEVTKVTDTMKTSINTGGAIIEGYTCDNSSTYELTHDTADATNPRIDLIILRMDLSERSILPAILKGTPAASPTAPELTQTTNLYEIALASVTVGAGVSTLNASTLTDLRTYAAANAQNTQIYTGIYTGDGNASQTISLTFTPSAVLVYGNDGSTPIGTGTSSNRYGGLALNGYPSLVLSTHKLIEIITNGFKAYYNSNKEIYANQNSQVYHYIAFR